MVDVTDLNKLPVPSGKFPVAKRNSEDLDQLISGPAAVVQNRAGNQLRSWKKIQDDMLTVNFTGDWVTATNYFENDAWRSTVDGVVYIVIADYTSGASEAADIALSPSVVAVYQTRSGDTVEYDTLADAIATVATDVPVNGFLRTIEYSAGSGGGNTYQLLDAGSPGARPAEDGGSVVYVAGGSGGLYLSMLVPTKGVDASWFGLDLTGSGDNSPAINAAIAFAENNGIARVELPSGRLACVNSIVATKAITLVGAGRGFRDDFGTVIEKTEGTDNGQPIIQIGSGAGSIPFIHLEDITIIGDTTDLSAEGIYINTTGAHGLTMTRLHISYVQGVPIRVNNPSSVARAEFVSFEDINVGMDFTGYGGRDPSKSRSVSPASTGIQLQGFCDEVNVRGGALLGNKVDFNANINAADCDGDVLNIDGVGLNGALYGVHTKIRELSILGGYIEGSDFAIITKNDTGNINTGCKSFSVAACLFASCDNVLFVNDTETSFQGATKGTLRDSFIFSNFTTATNGINVVYETGAESVVQLSNITTMMSNENSGLTGCRAIRSGSANASDRVIGQRSLFREGQFSRLENPVIYPSDSSATAFYELRVNASGVSDNGIQLKDSTGINLQTWIPQGATANEASSIFINVKRGGASSFKQIKLGAADSAGVGFTALRIENP